MTQSKTLKAKGKRQKAVILAIDTSCDETSIAVSHGLHTFSNIVASQVEFHREFGGVVPHLAKRKHQEFLQPTYQKALKTARVSEQDLTHLAITIGPGLAPALEAGIAFAKQLAQKLQLPLIPINHMEAHLLSSFTQNRNGKAPLYPETAPLPLLGLLISGGHTQLVLMKDFDNYQLLGETLDDAIGEAFDKAAKMLGLGYPGGPIIELLAKEGQPTYPLPIPLQHDKRLAFSYSGLKTALLYQIQKNPPHSRQDIANYAASFQYAATLHLTQKLKLAINQTKPRGILLGGGATANLYIRSQVRKTAKKHGLKVFIPYTKKLFGDNAAMIATAAYFHLAGTVPNRNARGATSSRASLQVKGTVPKNKIIPPSQLSSLDRLPNLSF